MKRVFKIFIGLLILYILIAFAVHNSIQVPLMFGLWSSSYSLLGTKPNVSNNVPQETNFSESEESTQKPTGEPVTIPLWSVIYGCFIIGFTFSFAMGIVDLIRRKRDVNRLKKEIAKRDKEINELRKISLGEEAETNDTESESPEKKTEDSERKENSEG